MVGRMLDALRGLSGGAAGPPLRPNELRREEVRAERLRREARQPRMPPIRPPRAPEERGEPRAPSTAAPAGGRTERHPLAAALNSRAGLRQGWLVKEILGPPRALRPFGQEPES